MRFLHKEQLNLMEHLIVLDLNDDDDDDDDDKCNLRKQYRSYKFTSLTSQKMTFHEKCQPTFENDREILLQRISQKF